MNWSGFFLSFFLFFLFPLSFFLPLFRELCRHFLEFWTYARKVLSCRAVVIVYWLIYISSWFNKSCLGNWAFGHTEQCNDLPEWPLNNSFVVPNSQCPKQLLLNQLYTIIDVKATDVDDCILSVSSNKDIASRLSRVFRRIKANQKQGNILKWMNNKVLFLFIYWLVIFYVSLLTKQSVSFIFH